MTQLHGGSMGAKSPSVKAGRQNAADSPFVDKSDIFKSESVNVLTPCYDDAS